jgi:dTDP-4-dehydrorhamnose 3,5-epimerase-like enzyme
MAYLIEVPTHSDNRGNLTVIENVLPFEIKRIFYIYGVDDSVRGNHRHKLTIQAAICISGSCKILCDNNFEKIEFTLDSPTKCLVLNPEDYHSMLDFSKDAILLVLASEKYNPKDYIFEPYNNIVKQ